MKFLRLFIALWFALSSHVAHSQGIPGISNAAIVASASSGVTATYTDSVADTSDLTTYTFSSRAIGTAASNRYIVVAVIGGSSAGNPTVNSLTVGGAATTQVSYQNPVATRFGGMFITSSPFTSGTTADIVVTFSAAATRAGIVIWSLTGPSSATPTSTQVDTTLSGNNFSVSINVPASGSVISMVMSDTSTTSFSAGVTGDANLAVEATSWLTGGHQNYAAAQTGLTVSSTASTADGWFLIASAWGP